MAQTALTLEEFRARISATEVSCEMPGCTFRGHSMERHLRTVHKMSSGQYRDKYPDGKLISKIAGELMRRMDRKALPIDTLDDLIKPFEGGDDPLKALEAFAANFTPCSDPELMKLIPAVDPMFHFDGTLTKGLATAMGMRKNTFIEGPTGCGKTELVKQVHAQLQQPMIRVNMNGDATAATFVGTMRVDPQQGTYYKKGALPLAMERGYTLVCDEIDYCPPHIAAVLNPVLEHDGALFIPETGETIRPAPGFKVVATANTGGKGDTNGVYTGTEILNTAFLDRFPMKLRADYLPVDLEQAMLERRFPKTAPEDIKTMLKLAREVRDAFKKGELMLTLSTRKIIDFFEFRQAGFSTIEALNSIMLNWLDADDLNLVSTVLTRLQITEDDC